MPQHASGAEATSPVAEPNPASPAAISGGGARVGVARGALHLVAGQTTSMVLGVVVTAIVGRRLGASGFGELYLVTSIATFALYFAEWGQMGFVTRTVAREPPVTGHLLGSAVAFRLGAVAVLLPLLAVLTRLIGYPPRVSGLLSLLLVASLPLCFTQVLSIIFRARDRMDLDALCNVCGSLIGAAVSVTAVLLVPRVEAVLVATGITGLAMLAVYAAVLRRFLPTRPRVSFAGLRELLVGGFPFLLLALAIAVQPYLDATLMSRLAPSNALGWYGASARMVGALVFPAGILGTSLLPTFSRLSVGEPARFQHALRSTLRPVLAMGSLAACGTWLLAEIPVRLLYGRAAFAPTIQVLRAFAPFLGLVYINMVLGYALLASGRQRGLTLAKLGAVLICVALEVHLIPAFQLREGNGGIGVAVSLGAAELLLFFAALFLLGRRIVNRLLARDFATVLLTCGSTVAVGLALAAWSPFVRIPAALLTFAALALVCRLVRPEDARLFRDALRSRLRSP